MGNQTSVPEDGSIATLSPRYAELLRPCAPDSPRINQAVLTRAHQAQLLKELRHTTTAMPKPQWLRPTGQGNSTPSLTPPPDTTPNSDLSIFHPAAARLNRSPRPPAALPAYATPVTKLRQFRIPTPGQIQGPQLSPRTSGPPNLSRPSLRIEAIALATKIPDSPQWQPPRPESPRLRYLPQAHGWPQPASSPTPTPFQSSRPAPRHPSRLAPASLPPPSDRHHTSAAKAPPSTLGSFFSAALSNFRDFFLGDTFASAPSRTTKQARSASLPSPAATPAAGAASAAWA